MRALSAATVFAAISGFVIIYIASWALGTQSTGQFIAYWGLFFALTGFVDGLMQETTRAVAAAQHDPTVIPDSATKPLQAGVVVAVVVGAATLLGGMVFISTIVATDQPVAAGLLAVGIASYAFQAVVSGVLSGTKSWIAYSWLVAGDSGIRMVLCLVAWQLGWGLTAFLLITVIGAFSWVVIIMVWPATRAQLQSVTDVPPKVFARNASQAMVASGATAVLITGFPTIVQATTSAAYTDAVIGSMRVTIDGIIMAVILTRAPILVPLQRFQSALIVRFASSSSVGRALVKPLGVVAGIALVGALAAAIIGPWILAHFFADGFQVPGTILAALTIGAGCTGMLMITGTATLAAGRHSRYVVGWIVADIVAFAVLVIPASVVVTVTAALVCAPAAGALVHVGGLPKKITV